MFKVLDLAYDYKALEPYIDGETMHLHHGKHHQAYVKNLNDALSGEGDLLNMDVDDLIANLDKVPQEIRTKVRNNAGGHSNHSLFWVVMAPPAKGGGGGPKGEVAKAINSNFGDFKTFQEKFSGVALSRFGSGWAWLIVDDGELKIVDTPNQDSPLMEAVPDGRQGKVPILGLDVWEHAYYLKYQNRRADYIRAWWNVVNWEEVENRFRRSRFGERSHD